MRVAIEALDGHLVAMVSCGADTTAAVTLSGSLYTWGEGSHGRLGLGHQRLVRSPTHVRTESRVGRFRQFKTENILAFAMVGHARLGESSIFLFLLPELVERIAEAAHVWPSGVGNGPNSSAVWGSAQLPLVRSLGGGIVV
mmetsp:Transcript_22937/g.36673  ORF Transcript_22937/g.36673 Transcript_22937/m.36673 type:complete len:141 (+) Transcript_22937:66-488(+)